VDTPLTREQIQENQQQGVNQPILEMNVLMRGFEEVVNQDTKKKCRIFTIKSNQSCSSFTRIEIKHDHPPS
jgi:hypothetical protein